MKKVSAKLVFRLLTAKQQKIALKEKKRERMNHAAMVTTIKWIIGQASGKLPGAWSRKSSWSRFKYQDNADLFFEFVPQCETVTYVFYWQVMKILHTSLLLKSLIYGCLTSGFFTTVTLMLTQSCNPIYNQKLHGFSDPLSLFHIYPTLSPGFFICRSC